MAGVAASLDLRLFRRVLRMRRLVAGPLAVESQLRHDPVMVEEILDLFSLAPGKVVVDGTLGLAGHSLRFAERLAPGGVLVGFDWDETMLARARERLSEIDLEKHLVHGDFRALEEVLAELKLMADAILLDLGLNSAQIDDPDRGMSFRENGPLDMRMDRSKGEPASSVLNRMALGELETMLWEFGDERWARKIARCILERRRTMPLRTTQDLVDCVLAAIPPSMRDKRIHPATRTFQAVRIYVNQELAGLEEALHGAARSLAPGGVLAVLSYHSGEDRAVKTVFRELGGAGFEEVYRKPQVPTEAEIRRNSRARSAKLRALRRAED